MYVSNVPISRPNPIPGVKPDADMNGFSWSNDIGLFFNVSDIVISSIKTPPNTGAT
jgi:hypothetical protein